MYPDFNARSGTNFFNDYGKWSKDLNGILKAAMGTANLHVGNFASDAATADTLQKKVKEANTHESMVDVTNAGNEVALGTYREMQQLRQMQSVQNAAQISFMAAQAGQADKKVAQDNVLMEMFSEKAKTRKYEELLKLNK